MRRPNAFATLVLLGVVADHTTKFLVFRSLRVGEPKALVPGWLEISPAVNYGVAFSFLQTHPNIILAVSVLALIAITALYLRIWRTAHTVMIWALGLLLVGAIGNLIDRFAFQYVRDFIAFIPHIPWIGQWATFNVADICITVGVILFLISEIFLRDTPNSPVAPQPPQTATTAPTNPVNPGSPGGPGAQGTLRTPP